MPGMPDGNRPGRKPGARRAFLHYAWSVRVGTVVICGGHPAPVAAIDDYAPGEPRPADCPIRPDYVARRWSTARGHRWVGWHPSEAAAQLELLSRPKEGTK